MGLLKSGFMQPVEDTTPIEESEETNPSGATLISDIPDDAFGHVLFWLPPLTNLAAARVAVARSDRNSSVLPPQLRRYVHAYLRFR